MCSRVQFRISQRGFAARLLLVWFCLGMAQLKVATAQVSLTNPASFFTNLSSRLLQAELGVGLNQIQAYPTNNYTPVVHRLLQVTANVWDAAAGSPDGYPTIFRPRFAVTNGAVYLASYVTVTNVSELEGLPLLDLSGAANGSALIPPSGDALVFGVPPILGARKGLPNFNEFAFEVVVSMTRKLQVRKAGSTITQTNQIFTMEVQMPTGVEFWNSYATNFNRPVSIYVTNVTSMTMTNDAGLVGDFTKTIVTGDRILATNDWRAYRAFNTRDPKSFVTLMRTNVPFLPQTLYVPARTAGASGFFATNQNVWDDSQQFVMPRWGITISNRVHAMIVDDDTQRIIDYVVLGNMTYVTNLTDIIGSLASLTTAQFGDAGTTPAAFKQLWATNLITGQPVGGLLSGRIGVIQQMNISVGAVPRQGQWESYGKFTPNAPDAAVALFNNFMYTLVTNGTATVPFTPIFQFRVPLSWQANDPLVHSLSGDLYDREGSGIVSLIDPAQAPVSQLPGLGAKNWRHQPWPFDPNPAQPDAFATDLKDPLLRASDEWDFPTPPSFSVEQLGQIHRGTPWQTVYLKASDLHWTNPASGMVGWLGILTDVSPAIRWRSWTGNNDLTSGFYTRPVRDRALLGIIAAALVESDPRQKLSVNTTDSGLWRGLFDALTVFTNSLSLAPTNDVLVVDSNSSQVQILVGGIASARVQQPRQVFQRFGDIFATPELSDASPWLNRSTTTLLTRTITDEMYEKIPAQLLSLVRGDSEASVVPAGTNWLVRFTGVDNYPYAVQVSTNFLTWTTVSTNYPVNGVFEYTPTSSMTSREFYRSVLLP